MSVSNSSDVTYRSLQEAKWARYLELLQIDHVYNPHHVVIDTDFSYSPSFWLPDVDLTFYGSDENEAQVGIYLDVITENDFMCEVMADRFPRPLVKANLLPSAPNDRSEELLAEQRLSGWYVLISYFDKYAIAEPHYHTLKQERWVESTQSYDKERMMIPFHEATQVEAEFRQKVPRVRIRSG